MNTVPGQGAGRRINPDSLRTLWVTVALVGMLGLTSFMVSFNGLFDVAAWVGLPWWMRWAVPIFIDIAILAYSMAAVIHRSRGEATWPTWLTLGVFTGVSVVANAAHALAKGEGVTQVQSWIGAGIAALAPLGVFAATEQLSRLAFATQHPSVEVETADPVVGGRAVQYREALEAAEESAERDGASGQASDPVGGRPAVQAAPEPVEPSVADESDELAPAGQEQQGQLAISSPAGGEDVESGSVAGDEDVPEGDDGFAAWVSEQVRQGVVVTGAMAGEFLGMSDRTGRNRLNELKKDRPEIFEDEEN